MAPWHGCAMVASKYPERQTEGDIFEYSADAIVGLGFSTTMSYANNGFDQDYDGELGFTPAPTSFKTLLETAAYQYLFGLPIPRHILQLWTFANGPASDPPAVQASVTQLQNEYNEVYDACVYLLQTYSNKEFIIKNWEGDWQLLTGFDPNVNVPGYRAERFVAFWGVRQRAIRAAVQATPSTSTIKYCLELNRCLDDYGYRLVNDVLPALKPDMVGWSAYEAINYWVEGWQRTAPGISFAGEDIMDVAAGNGCYIVVGTGGKLSRSVDGTRWYPQTSSFGSTSINAVRWVPALGLFVAVGSSGKIGTSPDGITWTQRTSGTSEELVGVIEDGSGNLTAFGANNALPWSLDGITWAATTYIGGVPPGTDYMAGFYDNGTSTYVIAGTNGKAVYGAGPTALPVTANFSTSTVRAVYGNGSVFVIAGDAGRISTASVFAATSWTSRTSNFGADAILDLTWGQSKFVAVGTTGKISTSPDGVTWTARTSGTGAYLQGVQYSATENVFAYGCDGATGYSLDGVNWIVNGQGAMGGLNVNAMFSAEGFTATGADNGTLSVAPYWHVQSAAEANADFYLRKGVARIRRACSPGTPVAITEYGWPQDQSNFTGIGLDVGRLIQRVIDTATALDLVGIIWWQIFDNEEQSPGVPRGFHLYSRDANNNVPGPLSAAGVKYASIL